MKGGKITDIDTIGNSGLTRFKAITREKGSLRVDAAALNNYLDIVSYHPGVRGVALWTESSEGVGVYFMDKPFKKRDWEMCFSVSCFGFIDWCNERYSKKMRFYSINVELLGWFESNRDDDCGPELDDYSDDDCDESPVSYIVKTYKPENTCYADDSSDKARRQARAISRCMQEENGLRAAPVLAISRNGYLGVITEEDEPPIDDDQVVIWYDYGPTAYNPTGNHWYVTANNRRHLINLLPYKGWSSLN